MARRPVRGSATDQDTGKSCPFCRFPIKEKDEVVACGECSSTHHEDCWEENCGCAIPGCAGAPEEAGSGHGGDGSHLPPVAGPSKKKVTIDPRPAMRRRKRERQMEKSPAAKKAGPAQPGRSSKATLWVVGITVAFLAVIGAVMIANSFDGTKTTDDQTCEKGTGVDGIHCFNNGALPNISNAQMTSEVTAFLRKWFRDINLGEYYYAWSRISPRVRKQIEREIGYQGWINRQDGISKNLDSRNLTVTFAQPGFPDEGVLSVRMSQMPYTEAGDRCGTRGGVTWVKWDPKTSSWYHEPGARVTSARNQAWGYRRSELFAYNCR